MNQDRKEYERLAETIDQVEVGLKLGHNFSREELDRVSEDFAKIADILFDYVNQERQFLRLMEKYEKESPAIIKDVGFFQCPACRKRTGRNHTHCHWCGKKIGWGRRLGRCTDISAEYARECRIRES